MLVKKQPGELIKQKMHMTEHLWWINQTISSNVSFKYTSNISFFYIKVIMSIEILGHTYLRHDDSNDLSVFIF